MNIDKWISEPLAKALAWGMLLLSLPLFWMGHLSELRITTDSAYYAMGLDQILAGEGFQAYAVEDPARVDERVPITKYGPSYSWFGAQLKGLFGLDTLGALKWTNAIFLLAHLLGWMVFFRLMFAGRPAYFLLAFGIVLSGQGIWSYLTGALSEPVFVAPMVWMGVALLRWHGSEGWRARAGWLALAALLALAMLLGRKTGLAFVAASALAVFLSHARADWRRALLWAAGFGLAGFLPYGAWLLRNKLLADKTIDYQIGDDSDTLFNFPRIAEILDMYFVSVAGWPTSLEPWAWLLLLPLAALVLWRLWDAPGQGTPAQRFANAWLFWMLVLYVGMVLFVGIFQHSFNREMGFMRYFHLTLPLLGGVLVFHLQAFADAEGGGLWRRLMLLGTAGLVAFVLLANLNRSRVFFATLAAESPEREVFARARALYVPGQTLLLSNHWQTVAVKGGLPAVEVGSPGHARAIAGQARQAEVYLLLRKSVGHSFRRGAPTWEEFQAALPTETVAESPDWIVARLLP